AALAYCGGWDAHNVTEDADLGMRLFRRGWRTRLVESTTEEEANFRVVPWMRQRSRWLKGFLLTWLSHVRAPGRLWREMGPLFWLSLAVSAATGGSLWAHWMPESLLWAAACSLIVGQAVMVSCALRAVWRKRALDLALWVPLMPVYWTLGAIAAWKAVGELFVAPTYWDKTRHGVSRLARRG
ncbi:MAG: glycosyltransferase family 2 protein, partial [Pseudomonadota bacterium]